ncbi:hypothetical protein [Pseudomonas ovata]|uniref:hypothetical protein n=1 Tax=Pseudomonas ovata TaxID=1839709 RepID=UPI000D68DF33|nr:hypothetical protein [Pseudomonas ovata]
MTTVLKLSGVTLPGSAYPKLRDFVAPAFPDAAGLVGLYTFGSRSEMNLVNHANPSLPLVAHGTLPTSDDGVVVSKLGYFDTRLAQDDEYTVIALCLPLLAASYNDGQLLYNNYMNGAAVQGESIALFGNVGTSVPSFGTFLNATGNTLVPKPMALPSGMSASRHAEFAVRVNQDGSTKVFVQDQGVLTTGVSTAQARLAASAAGRTMLIGPGYLSASSWAGNLTVKLLAVWSGPLTDQQIQDNINYLSGVYSDLIAA